MELCFEGSEILVRRLVIDADPGIADALAILIALAEPDVEVMALTACAGTVSGIQATRNLHQLIELSAPPRFPRVGQSDQGRADAGPGTGLTVSSSQLNGSHGLGDLEPMIPDLHNRRESSRLLVDLAREYPQEINLLTLGPLTNVALALDLDPELPMLLQSTVCLGGSLHCVGDVTASAEFNFWCDPAAARMVLRSPAEKTLVPLEVSGQHGLTFAEMERLNGQIPSTPRGEFITAMLQYLARVCRQHLPSEEVHLPAITALGVVLGWSEAESVDVIADVETSGELTAGALILDRRRSRSPRPNLRMITEMEREPVIAGLFRGLQRAAIG